MYKFMRFYNQNRRKIFKVILIVVFLFGLLQLLNFLAKKENDTEKQENLTYSEYDNEIKNTVTTKESVVTGEKVDSKTLKNETDVIDEFFKNCSDGNIDAAYDMLSDECKEVLFSTEENFNAIYCSKIFDGTKKIYSVENWTSNIYKVKISDDLLSTGKVSEDNTILDYVTVVDDDNDNYKLNVNKYIGRKELNKEAEEKDINIKVKYVDEYMDYTIYGFEVTNNSNAQILLDNLNYIDSMYLTDSNDMKYSAYTHELSEAQLKVSSMETRNVKIKYYSKYGSTKKISSIVFSRLISDVERYESYQNIGEYDGYLDFEIKL